VKIVKNVFQVKDCNNFSLNIDRYEVLKKKGAGTIRNGQKSLISIKVVTQGKLKANFISTKYPHKDLHFFKIFKLVSKIQDGRQYFSKVPKFEN